DGILGNEEFSANSRAESERIAMTLSRRDPHGRNGALNRPTVRELIDTVITWLGLDPIELEIRPRSRPCVRAKRLATWIWVHDYGGREVDLARALCVDTATVSRYYRQSVQEAGACDEVATAIHALLQRRPDYNSRI